jgi:membrane-associated protein
VDAIQQIIDILLHLDRHLNEWAGFLGPWLYLALFVVVFCETGLVVTPFLPGDSLLFAVGALAATPGSAISLPLMAIVLIAAAVLGDAANYAIGHYVGPRVFASERSRLFKREHLLHTQRFYEKHGGKTILLARFVPIVRTFAPFVAGIGRMSYARFGLWNIAGGVFWVISMLLCGFVFGRIPVVQRNFEIVILAIVGISLLPVAFEWLRARRAGAAGSPLAG